MSLLYFLEREIILKYISLWGFFNFWFLVYLFLFNNRFRVLFEVIKLLLVIIVYFLDWFKMVIKGYL